MRALRVRRRPRPSSVSVTIEADASRFVAACEDAVESLRRQRFRARLRLERSQGRAYVDGLLDDLCRRWGMDPVVVWREPRAREEQDRRDVPLAPRFEPLPDPVVPTNG